MADRDGAHRPPALRQVHRPGRDILAEQGAGDPRRAEPVDRQRDEQVLHRRPHRDHEHGLLGAGPPLIGVVVCRVGDQARHDEQRGEPERLAAPEPAGDLLLGEPVAAQVGRPGLAHRVQQRGPGAGRAEDDETPRLAVMRRRRGQRGGDRPADHPGIDGVGGERPDRPAGQRHIGRSEPEHVLIGRPDQRPCAGAILLGDQVRQPAHDRDRDPQRLPLDQVRGGRYLVGHRGHGDLQDVAERVGLAPVIAHGV